jgi:hypothetical protein
VIGANVDFPKPRILKLTVIYIEKRILFDMDITNDIKRYEESLTIE